MNHTKIDAKGKFETDFWSLVEDAHKELNYWEILKICQLACSDLLMKSEVEYFKNLE